MSSGQFKAAASPSFTIVKCRHLFEATTLCAYSVLGSGQNLGRDQLQVGSRWWKWFKLETQPTSSWIWESLTKPNTRSRSPAIIKPLGLSNPPARSAFLCLRAPPQLLVRPSTLLTHPHTFLPHQQDQDQGDQPSHLQPHKDYRPSPQFTSCCLLQTSNWLLVDLSSLIASEACDCQRGCFQLRLPSSVIAGWPHLAYWAVHDRGGCRRLWRETQRDVTGTQSELQSCQWSSDPWECSARASHWCLEDKGKSTNAPGAAFILAIYGTTA